MAALWKLHRKNYPLNNIPWGHLGRIFPNSRNIQKIYTIYNELKKTRPFCPHVEKGLIE